MEQTHTNGDAGSAPPKTGGFSELIRPLQGRMVAGVAQGIGENFGIHPWIPRLVFIVTTFMGGLGVALYAAGWVFIRSEDESETIADRFFSGESSSRSWIGLAFLVVAGIIILSNFTFLAGEVVWAGAFLVVGLLLYLGYIPTRTASQAEAAVPEERAQYETPPETLQQEIGEPSPGDSPTGAASPPPSAAPPPTAPRPTPPDLPPTPPREPSMLGRLTIGFMLLGTGILAVLDNIDAFAINAQPRHYLALAVAILGLGLLVGSIAGRARWLILVGVLLIPPLVFSPFFSDDWRSASFNRIDTPTEFTEVEPSYQLDVGRVVIDLTQLPWDGEDVEIDASINAGSLEIRIPEGVGIDGSASVNVGQVSTPERTSSGLGVPSLDWDETGELGTVLLDAHVNVGNIEIRR